MYSANSPSRSSMSPGIALPHSGLLRRFLRRHIQDRRLDGWVRRGTGKFQRVAELVVEQVDVRRERVGRRVVAEPALDLFRVASAVEQHRGARVAERVE